jgi:hypothetical protein
MQIRVRNGTARNRILTVKRTAVAVYGTVDSPTDVMVKVPCATCTTQWYVLYCVKAATVAPKGFVAETPAIGNIEMPNRGSDKKEKLRSGWQSV